MKTKIFLWITAAIAVIAVAGCASNSEQKPFVQEAAKNSETAVRVKAIPRTIVSWQGMNAGLPAVPEWLQDAALTNYDDAARKLRLPAGGTGSPIYRYIEMTAADLRGAQMRSDANFARVIAKELQTHVNVFLANESMSASINEPTRDAIGEITQTRSEVTISGGRIVGEHWQEFSTEGRSGTQIILFRLYRFEANDWAAIAGGYMQKILDQLPVRQRPEEKAITEMLQYALGQSRAHEGLTLQQRQNELDAQQRMVDAQINMQPQQQRAAAAAELAKIQAETERTRIQAVTARDAEIAAYSSQNQTVRSAASTTVADAPMIDAAKIALDLVF
ncbi:MAG: hypothetical protein FWB86_10460 [Treponema sp.]|nr:hypothetical protein [Treponema sp.]MCL2251369.1 hypothetical protein [Treponema sp.]